MDTRKVFDVITGLVANYTEVATKAVREGDGKIYVPGYMSLAEFAGLVANPSQLIQTGGNTKEPAYISLEEGLRGKNADGSAHDGFVVMDVIDRKIVSIIDRNGIASFDDGNPNKEVMQGRWGGCVIDVINSKGEEFHLETVDGVRGMNIPVTVIFENGQWSATHEGHPLAIKSRVKVV